MNDPATTPEMKLTILQDGAYAYSGMGLDEFEITEMTAGNSKTLSSDIREHCEYLEMKLKENFRKDTKAETNAQIARLAKLGYDVTGICNWVNGERYALAEAAEKRRLEESVEAKKNLNNYTMSLEQLNRKGRAESNKQAKEREKNRQKWDGKTINYAGFGAISDEDLYQGLKVVGGFLKDNVVDPIGEKAAEYVGGEYNFQTMVGGDLEFTLGLPTGLYKKGYYADCTMINCGMEVLYDEMAENALEDGNKELYSKYSNKSDYYENKMDISFEKAENQHVLESHSYGGAIGINRLDDWKLNISSKNAFDIDLSHTDSMSLVTFTNKTSHFVPDDNKSLIQNVLDMKEGRIGQGVNTIGGNVGFGNFESIDEASTSLVEGATTEFNIPVLGYVSKLRGKDMTKLNKFVNSISPSYNQMDKKNEGTWAIAGYNASFGLEYARHSHTFELYKYQNGNHYVNTNTPYSKLNKVLGYFNK